MAKAVIQASILGGATLAVLPNATITVRDENTGALTSLWSDRGGTAPTLNPTSSDANGFFRVYANPGRYRITATLGALTREWRDVVAEPLAVTVAEVIDLNYDPIYRNLSDYVAGATYGFLVTGQSLAEGGVSGDAVDGVGTPLYANNCFMFSPRTVAAGSNELSTTPVALAESGRVTIGHSFTRGITADALTANATNRVLLSGQAWGGKAYTELKKGGSTGVYELAMAQVAAAVAAFPGIEYKGIAVIHGEQDGLNNNASYAADLNEWQTDFNTDIKLATGQTADVPMFICQTNSTSGYGRVGGITETTFPTALQQLAAHETYPNIHLVCPKYFLPYADHSHITNAAQRMLGEYYYKAYKVVRDGGVWNPLRPSSVVGAGSTVTITFSGNVGSLVFDTTLVEAATNHGFAYVDDAGRTITNVAISGGNQVVITLSGAIGANPIVSYAYHNGAGGADNQVAGLGERGNLRDSDTAVSLYDGASLYNWAVTFRKQVVV